MANTPILNKKHVTAMVKGGMKQADVARAFGVTPSAITQLMQRVEGATAEIQTFREHKAKTMEFIQAGLAANLNVLDAKDAQSRIVGIGILADKIAMERGQATSYVAIDIRALIQAVRQDDGSNPNG